jgi:AraC-like DNA-binding protein
MDAVFTIGIFLSFFIAFLLLTKKQKALTDKILAAWVSFIGIHLLSYYLYHLGYWEQNPHLIGITAPFPLLHGPMLFLYTRYSLLNTKKIMLKDYFHLTPVVAAYLYMTPFFFFYSAEKKIMVDNGLIDDYSLFSNVLLIAFFVSGITYSVLSYKQLNKHKRLLKANFSYEDKINLNWLKYCIWGIGLIFLTGSIIIILREGIGIVFPFNADLIFYTMIVVFIFSLGFFGIRHQDMFSDSTNKQLVKPLNAKTPAKYQRSGLKVEKAGQIHKKLLDFMNTEKPFLNPKLTLSNLADSIAVSPNQLSQIINQYEQVNFHDFINQYRVEEFIRIARENTSYSFLAIALDAGFNSKSSFNGVFKKHKGMTPSQYIYELKNS